MLLMWCYECKCYEYTDVNVVLWMQCYECNDMKVYDASMNVETTEIYYLGDKTSSLGNTLMGTTGEERLPITFKLVKTTLQGR